MKFKKQWSEMKQSEKLVSIKFFPEEAKRDKDRYIRLEAYRVLGYTKEALQDKNISIRLEAWRFFGYTKESLRDGDWRIRSEAYKVHGYTEEALKDGDWRIRFEAELFFSLIETEPREVTMKEVCEKFGEEVKIIKAEE